MAKIQVGCQLMYQGARVICTQITTETCVKVAEVDSAAWRSAFHSITNYKVLAEEWDDFVVGDIVKLEYQRVTFEAPGENVHFLFTYHKVKKETLDGLKAASGSDGQATDGSPESNRDGN